MSAEELSFVVLLYSQVCEYILNVDWKKVLFNFFKLNIKCSTGFGVTEPSCSWMWGGGVDVVFYFCEARLPKEEDPSRSCLAVQGQGCVTDFNRSLTDRIAHPIGL